jgi:hypothetical protein
MHYPRVGDRVSLSAWKILSIAGPKNTVAGEREDVSVGQGLPSLAVEVTSSLIIAGALFSGEPMDVHHDRDVSIRRGFRDYFMNTMTAQSLGSRFVSDWAGPEAVIERFGWRLGVAAYINDDIYLTGKVTEIEPDGERESPSLPATGWLHMLLALGGRCCRSHKHSNVPKVLPEPRDANLARTTTTISKRGDQST